MAQHKHGEAHDDGGVHVHVHSWKFYAAILGTLLFLTIITVAASYLDIDGFLALGEEVQGVGAYNLGLAVLIATVKASLVVLFFMHLKDDARFNALVFVGSLLFIGVFFAYTMNDTALRGTMDRYNGVRVDPDTGLAAPGGQYRSDPISGQAPPPGRPDLVEASAPPPEHGAAEHGAAEHGAHEPPAAEAPAVEEPAPEPAVEEPAPEAPVEPEAPPAEEPAAEAPAEPAVQEPAPRPRGPRPPAAEPPPE